MEILKKLLLFSLILFLYNCAPNHKLMVNGSVNVEKPDTKKDNLNRIFIMEQAPTWTNNWHCCNNYYIDGKYIAKLTYGMVKIYETIKKQVELSIGSTYSFSSKFANSNKIEENNFGLRKVTVNFNNSKNKYFISQTKYGNFQGGGSLLSMAFFENKLKSEGEPFKLIAVNEKEWWNAYNNPKRIDFIKHYKENDLIKARQVQGIE